MSTEEEIRAFWDADAGSYDAAPSHGAPTPTERAAWTAALRNRLPASGRVLDVGAGTGFLALTVARIGLEVTAIDVSPGMLQQLRDRAEQENLRIEVQEVPADAPPEGPFDAVIERHVVWTLPDPERALGSWRRAAPDGRLLLFEGLWNVDPVERARAQLRSAYARVLRRPPHHHGEYGEELLASLPFGRGAHPDDLIRLVESAGWGVASIERLRDIEWARQLARPAHERPLGGTPVYAITAG